jgi:hypothetical protein
MAAKNKHNGRHLTELNNAEIVLLHSAVTARRDDLIHQARQLLSAGMFRESRELVSQAEQFQREIYLLESRCRAMPAGAEPTRTPDSEP